MNSFEKARKLEKKLERRVESLRKRYHRFENGCHFEDVSRNLLNGLRPTLDMIEEGICDWDSAKDSMIRLISALDTYLNLVEGNPEFLRKEFRQGIRPAFMKTRLKWHKGKVRNYHEEYVRDAAERVLDLKLTPEAASFLADPLVTEVSNYEYLYEPTAENFRHIANNLATPLLGNSQSLKQFPGIIEKLDAKDISRPSRALRTYLDAIERYSEFRHDEFYTEGGHFPDIPLVLTPEDLRKLNGARKLNDRNAMEMYVNETKRRLEAKEE